MGKNSNSVTEDQNILGQLNQKFKPIKLKIILKCMIKKDKYKKVGQLHKNLILERKRKRKDYIYQGYFFLA